MKIKSTNASFRIRKQVLMIIMRTFIFLCCTTIFALTPSELVSQNSKIKIEENKTLTIDEVFDLIAEQTEYRFFYEEGIFKDFSKVELKKGIIRTNKLLKQSLSQGSLDIEITEDNAILIKTKPINVIVEQQQLNISGTVTDANGQPLLGVNIIIVGTTKGAQTDFDGNFTIGADEGDILEFSFVGMKMKRVTIGNSNTVNVQLNEDATSLDEIVVVGYGTQKKSSVTGSVAQIGSEEITVAPTTNVGNMLGGRLPGLVVKQNTGIPGQDNPTISIRGFNTAGESALVIVDGVERDFQQLDPNEIESITILKDGAAAIYGARAASGVVLVTTKRGLSGKPVFTYNGTLSLQSPTTYAKTVGAKDILEWTDYVTKTPLISDERKEGILNGTIPSTDFQDDLMRKWAPFQQHNFNVRGGSERTKYFVSLGYMDQGSVFVTKDYGYKRFNLSSNLDLKISENMQASVDLGWRREDRSASPRGSNNYFNFMSLALPYYPIFNTDGSLSTNNQGVHSAYAATSEDVWGSYDELTDVFNSSISLKYQIPNITGLTAEGKFSLLSSNRFDKDFAKTYSLYADDGENIYKNATINPNGPKLTEETRASQRITTQLKLNYNRDFGVHHVDALALRETINYEERFTRAARVDLISNEIPYLFTGSSENQSATGDAYEDGRESYVGRIRYSFDNKYFVETTARFDAVSRFPVDTRWGFFPGISLGWRISEESFMADSNVINNLKLRLSAAKMGNDDTGGAYDYLSGFSIRSNTRNWYYTGGSLQTAIRTTGVANPFITWQESTIYNIGLDAAFLKGKLSTEIDVFYRKRTGLLARANSDIPETVGASLPLQNINSRDNRGFETVITYKGNISDFNYSISGNVTWNREKYLHYEEAEYTTEDDIRIRQRSGNWVNRTIGYVFDGFFNSQAEIDNSPIDYSYNPIPGDIRYVDVNGDGTVNGNDRTVVGKGGTPEWMYGLNFTAGWKNFDFTMFWQGAAGFVQNMTRYERMTHPTLSRVAHQYVFDNYWSEERNRTTTALFPGRWNGWNGTTTDEYLVDSKYIRLKNLSLGYNIPASFLDNLNIQSLRVYVAGSNLITIDGMGIFSEWDPENRGEAGYPQQKVITMGVNLSF